MVGAWTKLAPTKSFVGMTLEQFNAAIQPSLDARKHIADLTNEMTQALDDRDDADKNSLPLPLPPLPHQPRAGDEQHQTIRKRHRCSSHRPQHADHDARQKIADAVDRRQHSKPHAVMFLVH